MRLIRKGKSIDCTLAVLVDGAVCELEKSRVRVNMVRPDGVRVRMPLGSVEGNEIRFRVRPEAQLGYGRYGFEVWYEGDGGARTVADVPYAFELVALTQEERGEDAADLELSSLSLTALFGGSYVVVDNLESSRTDAALSANQGRVLKESIDALQEAMRSALELCDERYEGLKADIKALAQAVADMGGTVPYLRVLPEGDQWVGVSASAEYAVESNTEWKVD